jgi:hypothetical protein
MASRQPTSGTVVQANTGLARMRDGPPSSQTMVEQPPLPSLPTLLLQQPSFNRLSSSASSCVSPWTCQQRASVIGMLGEAVDSVAPRLGAPGTKQSSMPRGLVEGSGGSCMAMDSGSGFAVAGSGASFAGTGVRRPVPRRQLSVLGGASGGLLPFLFNTVSTKSSALAKSNSTMSDALSTGSCGGGSPHGPRPPGATRRRSTLGPSAEPTRRSSSGGSDCDPAPIPSLARILTSATELAPLSQSSYPIPPSWDIETQMLILKVCAGLSRVISTPTCHARHLNANRTL